jgi:hypothetical protein
MKLLPCCQNGKGGLWGLSLIIVVLTLSGCGGVKALRAVVGEEYQLTVEKSGNLASRPATTFADRSAVLAETLVARKNELGGKGIAEDELQFIPFAESTIILPDGQTHVLTVLYQARDGARILDGLQYGSFDLEKGQLRTVRAFLKDPAKLPAAPKPDMAVWSRMNELFRVYLNRKGAPRTIFGIEEMPVMTAEPARAGYLARYARRNPDGSLTRFAAIIDPSNDQVHVLYHIETD